MLSVRNILTTTAVKVIVFVALMVAAVFNTVTSNKIVETVTPIVKVTRTPTRTSTPTFTATYTLTPTVTDTPTLELTATETLDVTLTPSETGTETFTPTITDTPTITPTPGEFIEPFASASLCPDTGHMHDTSLFHTLWDGARGCHYDHEHGTNPFTTEVENAFPEFNLFELTGGVGVGHTNPSSPMENTHKHGGMKWNVVIGHPNGCNGHEGSPIGADASVIQYHAFGDYSIEFDARTHSAILLMRQCKVENPTDYGYVFLTTLQDYGQRVSGYQGNIMPFGDNPVPEYSPGLAPYFTVDCIGRPTPPCGRYTTYEQAVAANTNTSTTWTSDPRRLVEPKLHLFELLFRAKDVYQIWDWSTETFLWMCSNDGGETFDPFRCRHNNTTLNVHEINGTIPASWDNLEGFDTDSRTGRITAEGFVDRYGRLAPECTEADGECYIIKMVEAYVGYYGSLLIPDKLPAFDNRVLPERDVYFCNGILCTATSSGAVPSGWVGQGN